MSKTVKIILGVVVGIIFLCMGAYIVYTILPEDTLQLGPTATASPTVTATNTVTPTATSTNTPAPTNTPKPTTEPTSTPIAWIEKDMQSIEGQLIENLGRSVIEEVDYLITEDGDVLILIVTNLSTEDEDFWHDLGVIGGTIYNNVSSKSYYAYLVELDNGQIIVASVRALEDWIEDRITIEEFIDSWQILTPKDQSG